jgi:hypothetical protein
VGPCRVFGNCPDRATHRVWFRRIETTITRKRAILNILIAGGVGVVLSLVSVFGGVSAVQGEPDGVSQSSLYNYADD